MKALLQTVGKKRRGSMKKLACLFLLLLFSGMLLSCTQSTQQPTTTVEMIGPGDKIGDMTVVQGTYPLLFYPMIWNFCDFLLTGTEPVSLSSECTVPNIPGLTLSFGWYAKEALFESSREAMSIEFFVDGYKLDLDEFGWEDEGAPEMGSNVKSRFIILYLENISKGQHTFKVVLSMETHVDTGFEVNKPGIQEHIINFTVAEPEIYPTLTSTISTGQHRYRSEESGFDYLLYVPSEYGVDPQKKWPLILYLHGMIQLNNTLDSLEVDTLPSMLKDQGDYPFLVVSPLAKSKAYQFWPEKERVDALFILLEEIQTAVSVDQNRIYLTGESAGGNGTWGIGVQHPEYFAALVSSMGYYDWPFTVPENICDLKDVPVWAFHGAKDELVPLEAEQKLIDALEACGGNVQFTIFPDIGHEVDSQQVYTPELFTWLLDQTRE
jgi:acetyl esterase/lipase